MGQVRNELLSRLAFESKGPSRHCVIRGEDLPPMDWLGRPAELYCLRCGNVLRGGPIRHYQAGGEEDAWLYCRTKDGCGWFVEGREAVYQIRVAWLECDGLRLGGDV
jgi:hypothetical protein